MSDPLVQAVYDLWLDGLGPVGLSRAGRSSDITSGDCTDCPCEEDITLCVFSGQGTPDTTTPEPGSLVTITSDFVFGQYATTFAFNVFVRLQVISYVGWTPVPTTNLQWGARFEEAGQVGCGTGDGFSYYYAPQTDFQTFDAVVSAFALTSPTPFTLVIRVD